MENTQQTDREVLTEALKHCKECLKAAKCCNKGDKVRIAANKQMMAMIKEDLKHVK